LEQASTEGQTLLAAAGLASLSGEDPDRIAAALTSLRRTSAAELDQEPVALTVLGRAAVWDGDLAAAVNYHSRALEAASQFHDATGSRLAVADALRRQALTNPDQSAVDFDQAAFHAHAALPAPRPSRCSSTSCWLGATSAAPSTPLGPPCWAALRKTARLPTMP
jgi:hypothetical protein